MIQCLFAHLFSCMPSIPVHAYTLNFFCANVRRVYALCRQVRSVVCLLTPNHISCLPSDHAKKTHEAWSAQNLWSYWANERSTKQTPGHLSPWLSEGELSTTSPEITWSCLRLSGTIFLYRWHFDSLWIHLTMPENSLGPKQYKQRPAMHRTVLTIMHDPAPNVSSTESISDRLGATKDLRYLLRSLLLKSATCI